jgi:hypothetical protein
LTPDTPPTPVETVLTGRRGAVLIVTLNRPERLDAWTDEMEDRYFDVLAFADSEGDVRAVVLTGAGRGSAAERTSLISSNFETRHVPSRNPVRDPVHTRCRLANP